MPGRYKLVTCGHTGIPVPHETAIRSWTLAIASVSVNKVRAGVDIVVVAVTFDVRITDIAHTIDVTVGPHVWLGVISRPAFSTDFGSGVG